MNYYFVHFIDKETTDWRGEVICQSHTGTEPRLESTQLESLTLPSEPIHSLFQIVFNIL